MTEAASPTAAGAAGFVEPGPAELHSALFAQMVMQQSNLALMLLGRVPNPETGQPMRDLDAARLFIDQLEMLEAKTKGNLNAQESALLKQSLMTLRLAFVEAVNAPASPDSPPNPAPAPGPDSAPTPVENTVGQAKTESPSAEAQERKRFSKKY